MNSTTVTAGQLDTIRSIIHDLSWSVGAMTRSAISRAQKEVRARPSQWPPLAPHTYEARASSEVPPGTRQAVERITRAATSDLGLTGVSVRYYAATPAWAQRADNAIADLARHIGEPHTKGHYLQSPEPMAGRVAFDQPDTIWVRADLTPLRATLTAAHELRHVWQIKHGYLTARHTAAQAEAAEADADDYALAIAASVRPA